MAKLAGSPDRCGVAILGSTGTIGRNTLDVIRHHPDRYRVVALTAFSQVEMLVAQCVEFKPEIAVVVDQESAESVERHLNRAGSETRVLLGADHLEEIAALSEVDTVMAGIVGAAGLLPTLAAVRSGKRVLVANKEPLVMMGELITEEARANNAILLPIDSEHNAIFQCLPEHFKVGQDIAQVGVRKILLTGSGGPFRGLPLEEFSTVTPEQACQHPNWVMGPKISVDSATMMNKGLEIIEACWLFSTPHTTIEVVVHPQSVIHSMVEYSDGSIIAQLGASDMRIPIAYGLAWPERLDSGASRLDLGAIAHLDFEPPDPGRFPCLRLARESIESGGTLPTILNAANEIVVDAYLNKRIRFDQIPRIIEEILGIVAYSDDVTLEKVLEADERARASTLERIEQKYSA